MECFIFHAESEYRLYPQKEEQKQEEIDCVFLVVDTRQSVLTLTIDKMIDA
jgi:hypothetical protein